MNRWPTDVVAFVAALLATACGSILGYDEVTFEQNAPHAQSASGGSTSESAGGSSATTGMGGEPSLGGAENAGGAAGLPGLSGGTGGEAPDAGPESAGAAGSGGSAGGAAGTVGTASGGSGAVNDYELARQACVDKVNALRASVGVAPLTRKKLAEACVDAQIKNDQDSGVPHGTFGKCGEATQNECWGGNPILDHIVGCTQSMFDAGPGEGHHDAIVNPAWTQMACGIYWNASAGYFAFAQDFFL